MCVLTCVPVCVRVPLPLAVMEGVAAADDDVV